MKNLNELAVKAFCRMDTAVADAKNEMRSFINGEDGDTNFISILVLLGIALALAGIFLGFKEQVLDWVNRNIGTFFSKTV